MIRLITFLSLLVLVLAGKTLAADVKELKLAPLLTLSPTLPIEMNAENLKESDGISARENAYNEIVFMHKVFPWFKVIATFLFIGFLLALRTIKSKPVVDHSKVIATARIRALETLAEIKVSNLPEKNAYDTFYTRLSDAVRLYIEERYRINAPAKTTQEFLSDLPKASLPPQFPVESLSKFLVLSDKVKFARFQPNREESDRAYEEAEKFITQA